MPLLPERISPSNTFVHPFCPMSIYALLSPCSPASSPVSQEAGTPWPLPAQSWARVRGEAAALPELGGTLGWCVVVQCFASLEVFQLCVRVQGRPGNVAAASWGTSAFVIPAQSRWSVVWGLFWCADCVSDTGNADICFEWFKLEITAGKSGISLR